MVLPVLLIANVMTISALVASNGFIDRYEGHDRYLVSDVHKGQGERSADFYQQFHLSSFSSEDGGTKLLVIGDSFAEDFVNCLKQNNAMANVQLSTFRIPAVCGNLMINSDIKSFVPQKSIPICCNVGWYTSQALQNLIGESEIVLLASAWKEWQMPFLQESLDNIEAIAGGKVFLLGRKDFGRIEVNALLEMPLNQRLETLNPLFDETVSINRQMRTRVPQENFIDFQSVIGETDLLIPIFTPKGVLVSYDGQHLTNEGARHIGRKLLQSHPSLKPLLDEPVLEASKER